MALAQARGLRGEGDEDEAGPIPSSRSPTMTYVVTEPCYDCKYTDCVTVCPCDCFYQDDFMLYIDPDACIDCDACRTECPVEAIIPEAEVPSKWTEYITLNAERVAAIRAEGGGPTADRQEPKLGPACKKAP
jgi:ferredoxin